MEENKKLLSIRDLVVKFRVRGRILTAIRGISLDIYENESIAIVGESGSGKSVFTKTFAGMLDENGFIDQGSIQFFDKTLSDTTIPNAASEQKMIARYAEQLNCASVYEDGAKIYRQMQALDQEKLEKGRLTEEEYQVFQSKIDDLAYKKTESYNNRLTLDTRKQKEEIKKLKAEEKKFAEELKQAEAGLKEAKKAKKQALLSDSEYLNDWNERKAKLKEEYDKAIAGASVSEETVKRNEMLAKEIVLSVDRFPFFKKKSYARQIVKKLTQAMKEGADLKNAEVREQLYKDITFRVEYRSEDEKNITGFANIDLAKMKYSGDWMEVRGERIATVFQDPMTSLNPIITIGKQITSVIIKHQGVSEAEARKRALILMKKVGIPNAEKRFDDYPFQYSGGMRQRIVIAIALSCQPKILICDEPTTALDVTIQAQILKLIKDLQKEFGYTIVFITHDLGVVANVADRVAVLYAGQIVELGKVEEVFYDPRHPYTWALLSSLPQLAQRNTKLFSIQGTPPSLYNKIVGDPFAPRNQYCMKIDTLVEPPYFAVSDTHIAKTWLLDPRSPKVEKPEAIDNIHEKLMNAFNI